MKNVLLLLIVIENITIRPGRKYAGIVKRLKEAADESGRSLNNYILYQLDLTLKKQKNEKARKGN